MHCLKTKSNKLFSQQAAGRSHSQPPLGLDQIGCPHGARSGDGKDPKKFSVLNSPHQRMAPTTSDISHVNAVERRQETRESAYPMPAALMEIRDKVRAFEAHVDERALTARRWAQQAEHLRHVTPSGRVEDGGETIRLGVVSPGCRACKAGSWDCIFLSMACNLSCAFCLTPLGFAKASAFSALVAI